MDENGRGNTAESVEEGKRDEGITATAEFEARGLVK